MPNNVSFGVSAKGVGKASSDVDRLRDKFDKLQKQSGKGILTGAAAGATLGAIGLVSTAVSGLTDVIGDSIQAARDDEVSIQKLGSSLRANIANWDGNTDAIEGVLAARMKLGFSDDEQRDSLAKLVVATHDVNKALEIQRTAMDLARLKGISLAEAGEALTKVEAGQFRALKALGIQLKAGATATDALRAVQAAAAGQAEDYAKTNEGKLLVSQVKVNEAMERFGYTIMPAVNEAMVGGADALLGFSTALDVLQGNVAKTTEGQQEQVSSLTDLERALGVLFPAFGVLADAQEQAFMDATKAAAGFDAAGDNSVNMAESIKGSAVKVEGASEQMEDSATDWRDTYRDVAGDIARSSKKVTDQLIKDAARLRGDAFDETEVRAELHDQRMALRALEERKRVAKTAEAHRQASDDIVQALDDEGESLEDLAAQGKLTKKDVDRFASDVKKNYASLSKEGRKQVDLLLARYRLLASQKNINKTFTMNYRETRSGTPGRPPGRGATEFNADGGPVKKGTVTWVGERGPELLEMGGDGFITPADMSKRAVSGGTGGSVGGAVTFQVTVNAGIGSGLTAGDARKLADMVGPALYADMQRRGMLARTGTGLRG